MRTHRLRDVAQVLTSNVDKVVDPDEHPVRLCNYVDVYKNNFIHTDIPFKRGSATAAEIKKFRVQVDDVIITKDSETADDIGVPALVKSSAADLVCGYHLSILRADRSRILGPYLYWHLLSKKSQEDFGNAANGVTRFGLTLGGIKGIPINVPDLGTQRQIADFLDRETARIDLLIEKKQRLVALLETHLEEALHAAVLGGASVEREAGANWLKDLPNGWKLTPLKHFVSVLGGATPSKDRDDYWNGDIPWVSPKDMKVDLIQTVPDHVSEPAIRGSALSLIPKGAVLIVVRGMILARYVPVCQLGCVGTINQDMKALIPDTKYVSSEYLQLMLKGFSPVLTSFVEEAAHGTKKLRSDQLFNMKFPLPSKEIQIGITGRLKKQQEQSLGVREKTMTSIDRLKENRSALITAAVTGQIDVDSHTRSGATERKLDALQAEMDA